MNFITKLILSAFASAMLALPALSQSVLGETELNGRKIILNDDFSWRYKEPRASLSDDLKDCFSIADSYAFCGRNVGWKVANKLSPDATASFRIDDRNYAMFIRENLGTDDGITMDALTEIIISNMAIGAGITEDDITIYSTEDFTLFDTAARRVIYGGRVSGFDVVYFNTIWLSQKELVQFLTFNIAKEPTDTATKLHTGSVDMIAVMK